MIQTLQNTITTAILWLAIAIVGAYLLSHAPDIANHLADPIKEGFVAVNR